MNGNNKISLIKSFDTVLSLDLLKEEEKGIDSEFKKYIEEKIEERITIGTVILLKYLYFYCMAITLKGKM